MTYISINLLCFRLRTQNGAFDICKASHGGVGTRHLQPLFGSTQYSVQSLKEATRSSNLYIVPLNGDIDTSPTMPASSSNVGLEEVICNTCGNLIALQNFRSHREQCNAIGQSELGYILINYKSLLSCNLISFI